MYDRSPGYGISLVAETTSGCLISADTTVSYPKADEMEEFEDSNEKPELMPPEDVGVQVASMLLGEIEQGGVVDSTHQVCNAYYALLPLIISSILLHEVPKKIFTWLNFS